MLSESKKVYKYNLILIIVFITIIVSVNNSVYATTTANNNQAAVNDNINKIKVPKYTVISSYYGYNTEINDKDKFYSTYGNIYKFKSKNYLVMKENASPFSDVILCFSNGNTEGTIVFKGEAGTISLIYGKFLVFTPLNTRKINCLDMETSSIIPLINYSNNQFYSLKPLIINTNIQANPYYAVLSGYSDKDMNVKLPNYIVNLRTGKRIYLKCDGSAEGICWYNNGLYYEKHTSLLHNKDQLWKATIANDAVVSQKKIGDTSVSMFANIYNDRYIFFYWQIKMLDLKSDKLINTPDGYGSWDIDNKNQIIYFDLSPRESRNIYVYSFNTKNGKLTLIYSGKNKWGSPGGPDGSLKLMGNYLIANLSVSQGMAGSIINSFSIKVDGTDFQDGSY